MPSKQRLPADLHADATARDGLITREQLLAAGLSRHVIARLTRAWTTLAPGHFSVASPTWRTFLRAGLSIGGSCSAAYGATALALHGMSSIPAEPVQILLPRDTQRPAYPWVRWIRNGRGNRRVLDSLELPRTGFEDAVIDAAADLSEDEAIALVARVIQEQRTAPDRLADVLDRRRRTRHRTLIGDALRDAVAGAHSLLEVRYSTGVERPHALPALTRQFVVPETGCVVDLADPDRRLLIELDGLRYHDPIADRERDNTHAAAGYQTIRLTWAQVVLEPCATAALIARALGLADPPHRCRRCDAAALSE